MVKNYSIILTREQATPFREFLHNIGADFQGSECGEYIYFSIYMKEELKNITETFLEKI